MTCLMTLLSGLKRRTVMNKDNVVVIYDSNEGSKVITNATPSKPTEFEIVLRR